jgi:hypothetical protein
LEKTLRLKSGAQKRILRELQGWRKGVHHPELCMIKVRQLGLPGKRYVKVFFDKIDRIINTKVDQNEAAQDARNQSGKVGRNRTTLAGPKTADLGRPKTVHKKNKIKEESKNGRVGESAPTAQREHPTGKSSNGSPPAHQDDTVPDLMELESPADYEHETATLEQYQEVAWRIVDIFRKHKTVFRKSNRTTTPEQDLRRLHKIVGAERVNNVLDSFEYHVPSGERPRIHNVWDFCNCFAYLEDKIDQIC